MLHQQKSKTRDYQKRILMLHQQKSKTRDYQKCSCVYCKIKPGVGNDPTTRARRFKHQSIKRVHSFDRDPLYFVQ